MRASSLYRIGLLMLFPAFIAIHGAFWITSYSSFAISVYAMKLVFLPFLIFCIFFNFSSIIKERGLFWYAAVVLICLILSMTTPFISGKGTNFYYYTDALGFAVTIISIPVVYVALKNKKISFGLIEKTSVQFLIIISIYIILYYFISGGMKISITPEMQIPMAIMFGAYFFSPRSGYRVPMWVFPLVFIGCLLSQLRENMVVFMLLTIICLMRWSRLARLVLGGIGTMVIIMFAINNLTEITDVKNAIISADQNNDFLDISIMQRFVEIDMVYTELQRNPLSLFLGQGFGATYENIDGKLIFYGGQVHNVHSTPAAVYLRNGLYGVILYFIVFAFASFTIFSKNNLVFRTSLCLVIMYATLFFNQYLYWNVQFGLSVAMWLYSMYRKDTES